MLRNCLGERRTLILEEGLNYVPIFFIIENVTVTFYSEELFHLSSWLALVNFLLLMTDSDFVGSSNVGILTGN